MAKPDTTPKPARRTPGQIAQDELDGTLAKLEKARARKTRAEESLAAADKSISELTSLSDYQSSHPALTHHFGEDDEPVTKPAGVTPVADA